MQLSNHNVQGGCEPTAGPTSSDDDEVVETLTHTAWVGWQYALNTPQK